MWVFLRSTLILGISQGKEAFALFCIFDSFCLLLAEESPAEPGACMMGIFLRSTLILDISQGKEAFALFCIFDSFCLLAT